MDRTNLTAMSEKYEDLEIRILELQEEGYPVEITFSGEQEFPRGFLKPDLVPWTPGLSPQEDGERLFRWLFADDQLQTAWAGVRGQNSLRRIRLRIDASAPELHAVPWELLRDAAPGLAPQTIAAETSTPFSRYLAGQWKPGHPILSRPIKLLVALANPDNLEDYNLTRLDIQAEQQALETAVAESEIDAEQLEITFLAQPVTLSALEAELKKGYHILHLVAHGIFLKEDEQACLFLANPNNQVIRVSDDAFAEMFSRQEASLRLVFLASCQSASRSSADAFRGLAPKLIAAGIPAVEAMQDLVPLETARKFSGTFYRQLLRHGQVDLAGNEARSTLLTAKLPGVSIPVLFMRLRSGILFGQRGQILGDQASSFWKTLLSKMAKGKCTPFLGPGVTRKFLPDPGELAQTLAKEYSYPFIDRDNLPHVTQFIGTIDDDNMREELLHALAIGFRRRIGQKPDPKDRRLELSEIIESVNWSELSQQLTENEIHHQLADLDLPLYITTNFDNFMTLALQARGKKPRRETITWREALQKEAASPYYDLDPPASPEEPVVLHLYGTDRNSPSMVVSEEDYLDYLVRIARDHEYLLPTSVDAALASTTLLFLGYRLEHLDLKVLMRGLLPHLDLKRWPRLNVAVQIEIKAEEEANEVRQKEVIDYFQRYFHGSNIDVYWGSTQQFVNDLHDRWMEYMK